MLTAWCLTAIGQDAPEPAEWSARLEFPRKLISSQKYGEARTALEGLREIALKARDDQHGLAICRLLLAISRAEGDWPHTEDLVNEELDLVRRLPSENKNADVAAVYSELAAARRAQRKLNEAVAAVGEELRLRGSASATPELARAWTTMGLLHIELKKTQEAKAFLLSAVGVWRSLLREDPEVLGAMEPLAGLFRDESDYADAEPLYERALRIREVSFGLDSAEVLGGLDNLAYCYFGSRKFAEAEPLYKRLLTLWESTAGPDHPMVALTLDKIVTFYGEQKRFEEADALAERALQIRARALVGSFRTRATLAAQQDHGQAAVEFITKAGVIGETAGLPRPPVKVMPAPKRARPVRPPSPAK